MATTTEHADLAHGTTRRSFLKLGAATAAAFGTYGLIAWTPRAEGRDWTIDLFIHAAKLYPPTIIVGRKPDDLLERIHGSVRTLLRKDISI